MLNQKLKLSESDIILWGKITHSLPHQPTTERSRSKFCSADIKDVFEIIKKNTVLSESLETSAINSV